MLFIFVPFFLLRELHNLLLLKPSKTIRFLKHYKTFHESILSCNHLEKDHQFI